MSSGSATGNPRNKVGLKPGHSLMDWIRLGNSGKDLSGTGGAYLNVTKNQLEEHNKPNDAWLCIRGKVYNVTSYMDFHPGGPEELMKGVGADATKMFNEVHAWVNYESILQKCVVGQLRTSFDEDIDGITSLSPFGTPAKPRSSSQKSTLTQNQSLKMDWFQQVGTLNLVFYTKTSGPNVHFSLESGDLLYIKINSRVQKIRLESSINWPCSVTVDVSGKVQVRLTKQKPGLWSCYGTMETCTTDVAEFWEASIVNSNLITHNTYQIDLEYTKHVFNYIPVGHHVFLKTVINEEEVVRPYTPVTSLAGISIPPIGCVRLIVKSYPSGTLSPWLTSQPPGTKVKLSVPRGSFSLQPLTTLTTQLVLLAAGTGFTPMVSLITWALRSSRFKVQMVFFNKTEKDIIWREQLDKLMVENTRFSVEHILSEPSTHWTGKTGYICSTVLHSYLPVLSADIPNTFYVCICGPTSFSQLTERCLKEDLGFTKNNYFCFLGQ